MANFFKRQNLNTPSLLERTLSYFILILWLGICLLPIYWLIVTSFKLQGDVYGGPRYLPFVDFQPSFSAWRYVFLETPIWRPYTNTVVISTSSTAIALILGASAAYSLVRFNFRPKLGLVIAFVLCAIGGIVAVLAGVPFALAVASAIGIYIILATTVGRRFSASFKNNDIAFWIISQRILPPIAVVIPIYFLFLNLNLLNTHISLIATYTAANLPIVVWLLRDFFNSIPIELEESAFVDGANRLQTFFKIVLPLAIPGLVATFIFTLVFAWNEYIFTLFLSRSDTQTLPLLVAAQQNTRGTQWWNLSVLVLIMIVPVIIMAVILERFIQRGILIGAVKG